VSKALAWVECVFPQGRYDQLVNAAHRAGFMRALRSLGLIYDHRDNPRLTSIDVSFEQARLSLVGQVWAEDQAAELCRLVEMGRCPSLTPCAK
jgi:hypothetical protein